MLSIIVSSYKEDDFNQFSKNVKETIGDNFQYEIIQQWNPGIIGICEAYNKGAEKAKYENLLFIHEDVLFETDDWGKTLIDYLQIDNIGCIGVAGASKKTRFPIAWWDFKDYVKRNYNQADNRNTKSKPRLNKVSEIKLIDGVFIAVQKKVWKEINFNSSENISFHGYDIEFSLDVSKKHQNYIIPDIIITHYSEGSPNKDWFLELIRIYNKNKKYSDNLKLEESYYSIELFLKYMRSFDLSKKEKMKYFSYFYNPFDFTIKQNIRLIKLFLFYY